MRIVRLMIAGLMGGAMLSFGIVAVLNNKADAPRSRRQLLSPEADENTALARCRLITTPDATCAALWEAERRRFFQRPERHE